MTSTLTAKCVLKDPLDTAKASDGRVEYPKDMTFTQGAIVYHKNPVGPNYIFKNKSGTITGFVNPTNKRAIIRWSNGQVKRHNVSSLTYLSPSKSFLPNKKRKCVEMDSATPEEQSESESDSDSEMDEEWMNSILSEI